MKQHWQYTNIKRTQFYRSDMLFHKLLRLTIFTIDHLSIMTGTNKQGNNKMPTDTKKKTMHIVSHWSSDLATKSFKSTVNCC